MDLRGKKCLVTGASGMLASDLVPLLQTRGASVTLTDVLPGEKHGQQILPLDITNSSAVSRAVSDISPDWIFNCAAYTAVDKAESDAEMAFAVNATGPGNLANAASDAKAQLLHLSTDYVFGGKRTKECLEEPFTEESPFNPCGVYGQSKCLGDQRVIEALPEAHLIVRTSWLHGVHGPNFLRTILRLAKEQEELKIVNDQIGSPTWAKWLAQTILELIEHNAIGTYHLTSRGNISWFDFATEICRLAGLKGTLTAQSTSALGRPAPRPSYSTLSLQKAEALLQKECISWKQGIREHLEEIGITPQV